MSKHFILITTLLLVASGSSFSQFFQWAKKYESPHGITVNDFAVDKSGNCYLAGKSQPLNNTTAFFIVKLNSSGKEQWVREYLPSGSNTAAAQSVAVDELGNCYVTGVKGGGGNIVFDSIHSTNDKAYVLKFSSSGNVLRIDSVANSFTDFHAITADSSGNLYITNGSMTVKYNVNGSPVWSNQGRGGSDIAIDKDKRVYLLKSGSLVKLSNKGVFAWSRTHGGNQVAADAAGNTFVASDDSIFKYNTSGTLIWSNKGLHGNSIAIDDLGKIYLALGNNLRKIDGNGTTLLWSLTTQNAFCKFIGTNNVNCFTGGEYDPLNETVITPFHFTRVGVLSPDQDTKAFVTKVNQVSPIPFQAGIYTPPIPGDRLCNGVYFQVPYVVNLNAASAFGPGNKFRAQLINPASGDTIDIGPADSAFIPGNSMATAAANVRVVSTNPVVVGDVNSPQNVDNNLLLEPLKATLTPAGNVQLCYGSSVTLHAAAAAFPVHYYWFANGNQLSTGPYDTLKSISTAGSYQYKVYSNDYICQLTSAVASVSVVPNPNATVTASGPLSFCNGDSVTFTVPFANGNSYQWKKNNGNIAGAVSNSYTAKTAGTYKVKVTGPSGCTSFSANQIVTVNCREGNGITDAIQVYPQPFATSFTIVSAMQGMKTIRIYDLSGKIVLSLEEPGDENMLVDMSDFSSGLYFLEVMTHAGISKVKIAKE